MPEAPALRRALHEARFGDGRANREPRFDFLLDACKKGAVGASRDGQMRDHLGEDAAVRRMLGERATSTGSNWLRTRCSRWFAAPVKRELSING